MGDFLLALAMGLALVVIAWAAIQLERRLL